MAGKTLAGKPRVRKSRLAGLGKPRGRKPFLLGHRVEFCQRHVSAWRDATAADPPTTSTFYDKTTNTYLQEIGYDFDVNAEGRIIPLPDDVDEDEGAEDFAGEDGPVGDQTAAHAARAEAIAQKKSVKRKALRKALSHWFRNNGNSSGSKKPRDGLSKKFDAMVDMAPEKPRRAHADQFFSTKHYDAMVKDRFDAHFRTVASAWVAAQAIPQQPGMEGLPSEDQLALLAGVTFEGDDLFQDVYDNWRQSFAKKGGKLVEVTLRAAFTRAVYCSQSDEFKESLKQELDGIYDKAMDTYRQLLDSADAEKTPEYYHEMQSKAPHYLYPFAEHMSKKLGMNVSIMVYGPISARGGAIGVKSIHVGTTNDPASLEWMDAEPEACEAMVKSMRAFGERCFTPEERAARALPSVASSSCVDTSTDEGPSRPTEATDEQQDAAFLRGTAPPEVPPHASRSPPIGGSTHMRTPEAGGTPSALSPREGRSYPSHVSESPDRTPTPPFMPSSPTPPRTPAAPLHAAPSRSAVPSKQAHGPARTPLFLPSSSPASAPLSHRPSQDTSLHRRLPPPPPSSSVSRPSRTASQPAPRVAPSVNMPSRRLMSQPAPGFVMQTDHPAASTKMSIDPRLEVQSASEGEHHEHEEPDGLHTPPLSPLIPEDESLVAPSFSNMPASRMLQPYVRRPFPSQRSGTARELEELTWSLLEDKREMEWNAMRSTREQDRERNEPENPFMDVDAIPKTPSRTPRRQARIRNKPPRPLSPLFSPGAPPFTQRFAEASSSPEPSQRAKLPSTRPPLSSSWPPSQPPPNALQTMEEMARRRRPAASVTGPARSVVAATTTSIVMAEKDTTSWPDKMRELYKFLTNGKDWGEGWMACVTEWVEIERLDGFPVDVKSNPNVGAFSATTRPEPVGRWIAYKRTAKDRPVGSLTAYSSAWWAWWGDCQPQERGVNRKGRPGPPAEDLDWSCMDVTTSCGLVLIIVSLSFWGAEVFKAGGVSSQQAQEWQDAVAQVTLAFTSIRRWKLDSEGGSAKRKSTPLPSGSTRPKKRRRN